MIRRFTFASVVVVGVLHAAFGLPVAARQETVRAVVGGTLVDGTGAPPVSDAVVLMVDGRIRCAGPPERCPVPAAADVLDARGQWVIPGLVDAHVHFSQTGWFDGRPDAADLREAMPYPSVIAELEANPEPFFAAYLCSGVTTVFDVGGYPWTWALRRRFRGDPRAPRIAAAGPLLSTRDFWVNLPAQQQFVYMADDATVRRAVEHHAAFASDALKIWYIMPPDPPDTLRAQALVRAAAAEAARYDLRLIVHATGLWQAKDAVRAGAHMLVHSVSSEPVDEEFIGLMRDRGVVYTPNLMVGEGYAEAAVGRVDGTRYPLDCADDRSRALVAAGPPSDDRLSPRQRDPRRLEARQRALATAMANAKRLHDAGVVIAVGTDAGNPGTLHGPSIYRETVLLQESGLTPMEVLVAATRGSAMAIGLQAELGTVEIGKAADLVVLGSDPVADIRNLRDVRHVVKGGQLYRR